MKALTSTGKYVVQYNTDNLTTIVGLQLNRIFESDVVSHYRNR